MFHPLIVIPLYNHATTVRTVAEEVLRHIADVLVVDDGSTDGGASQLEGLPLAVVRHEKNRGKGAAILTAAAWAKKHGFSHILTIDADGQHYAEDMGLLLKKGQESSSAIVIGARDFNTPNVPGSSKFGRKFSAFWARVQTGQNVSDIQSGLRLYPVAIFDCIGTGGLRYSFEVEVIIKSLWHGFTVSEVPVRVFYPSKEERVSHFKAFQDNARISLLNACLTMRALLPIPHRKYVVNEDMQVTSLHPFRMVVAQLKKQENPFHLGKSAAWGSFWGALALPGVRQMFLLWGIGWFNLNRLVAFSAEKLALPPLVPAICIEVGYRLRHGEWLTELSWQTLGRQFLERFGEWILGSLIVAPLFGLLVGMVVYTIGLVLRKGVSYGATLVK